MTEVDQQKGTSLAVWVLAAFGAVAIHAGCVALALEYLQSDDLDEATGAIAIEISVERTSPRVDSSDLPPGPDADASVASPAVVEQKAVVEQTELPKAIPTETEDPDRLVTPNDVKKPKDDDPKIPLVKTTPSIESVASEATAMPSSETAPEAPRSVAPAVGPGESTQRVRMTWQKELAAHLDRHKRYPTDRSRQPAEIVVRFELDRTGHVLSASIVRGSGDASFDEAALAMMRRADPVPSPPPRVADEGLTFTMPVIFRLKGQK
jgi:periplasmic protein TonB